MKMLADLMSLWNMSLSCNSFNPYVIWIKAYHTSYSWNLVLRIFLLLINLAISPPSAYSIIIPSVWLSLIRIHHTIKIYCFLVAYNVFLIEGCQQSNFVESILLLSLIKGAHLDFFHCIYLMINQSDNLHNYMEYFPNFTKWTRTNFLYLLKLL